MYHLVIWIAPCIAIKLTPADRRDRSIHLLGSLLDCACHTTISLRLHHPFHMWKDQSMPFDLLPSPGRVAIR